MQNTEFPGGTTARTHRGFTLIEVMIVVALVGILAAVAYPAYTDQVRKGRRADARAALMNVLQQQERYMVQRSTYATFTPGSPGTLPFKGYVGTSASAYTHQLGARQCALVNGVQPPTHSCVEVFVVPRTGTDPQVTEMAMDTQGRRTCTGSDLSRCWK